MARGVSAGRWDVWGDQCSQPGTGTAESQHSCRNPGEETTPCERLSDPLGLLAGTRGGRCSFTQFKITFFRKRWGTFTATKAWT